ncbi:U32 family peptidase [Methanobrevibacter sp.]|uniref:U32 family peptidase n=1 Tax=Methanobrevibacter sp. TaxID=66852 RepID=UPI0025E83A38|nr:U32 family peptidase [Methanobrevibacter sp.]MBQ2962077.1 U32 family peptidase [Methanobrevibacter sp.]
MKLPELLAPVGSAEHLKIAILSGANSIYLSGENFGARKYAENFTVPEIREAVKYAHLHNVKVYVTVNTLIKEGELEKVSNYLLELYKMGVDAVLIQDIGLVRIINENIPQLKIHASTQMNLHNIEGIRWASEHNIKRVVLPREMEINELKEIIDYAHPLGIEIEIFAHGALCYSYSGHCLISSMQGGRSGNRGTCAQPCRERYELNINKSKRINPKTEGDYLLSPRDLSLFEHLDEIVNLEVDSIKIEGRMRSNDYVATVVKNYRKRLNKLRYDKTSQALNRNIKELERKSKGKKGRSTDLKKLKDKENIERLKEEQKLENLESLEELELVFNREFTTGHLIPKNNPMIMNRKKPGHQGLYIGKIHRYNPQTEEIHILLKDNLINIPEKGDGILIENIPNLENNDNNDNTKDTKKSKTKQDKRAKRKEKRAEKEINPTDEINNIQTYGFDISSKPVLKDSKDRHWRKREKDKDIEGRLLVIKRVRENKRINFPLKKGSKVYLTKKNSLLNEVKDLPHKKENHYIKKSLLELYFRIDSDNYPHLKGNLKLDNGKVITLKVKGENPWEEAINKPISNETIRKQLLKIGDLPYYIEKITINNNKSLFSPISEINELRRTFFNRLEEEIIESYRPNEEYIRIAEENIRNLNEDLRKRIDLKSKANAEKYNLSAYINSLEILRELNKSESIFDRIYLEIPPNKDFEEISQNILENKSIQEHELNISYCVNFLKEAIEISRNQDYKLIWKLPDIAHKQTKESIIKIIGILKKMNLEIDIMTSLIGLHDSLKDKFNLNLYGNYPLNAYNIETVLEMDNFEVLCVSPEIYKKNIKDLMEDYYKELPKNNNTIPELEVLVHGNIESMITRKELISKKQLKLINKYKKKSRKGNANEYYIDSNEYYLRNRKDQHYPIKTNLNEDNIIILNSEELCLLDDIDYLKSIGISSFSIDARWKSLDYIRDIGKVYRELIDKKENDIEESRKAIAKHCPNLTKANFEKGLK